MIRFIHWLLAKYSFLRVILPFISVIIFFSAVLLFGYFAVRIYYSKKSKMITNKQFFYRLFIQILLFMLFLAIFFIVQTMIYFNYKTVKIDPKDVTIYVVNMDKNKDRWNLIHNKLTDLGLKHERFPATVGIDLKIKNLENNEIINLSDVKSGKKEIKPYTKYLVDCGGYKQIIDFQDVIPVRGELIQAEYIITKTINTAMPGVIGHYCSMVRVLNHVAKNNELAIITEDDANTNYTKEEFLLTYNKILSNLPKNWQIVLLFHSYCNNKYVDAMYYLYSKMPFLINIVQSYPEKNKNELMYTGPNAQLYMINGKGAKILLSQSQRSFHAYDTQMGNIINLGLINAYYVVESKSYNLCSKKPQDSRCLDTKPTFGNKIFMPLGSSGVGGRFDEAKTTVW